MTVWMVTFSTDFYGYPEEQRMFSSGQTAYAYKAWLEANSPDKHRNHFNVDVEEFEVEDSF